jgi:hypothetical protein
MKIVNIEIDKNHFNKSPFSMPIRFDDGGENRSSGQGTGPSKGLIAILLVTVFFLFRKPKIMIPLLVVAAIVYFFFFYTNS